MKLIQLTQGKFAQVDDDDFEYINSFKWQAVKSKKGKTFYAVRRKYINGKKTLIIMHRIIMNLFDKKLFIDHIDFDGLNNQKLNLRTATFSQSNSYRSAKSKYVYRGIRPDCGKWESRITLNKKQIRLGRFKTQEMAALAYNEAAIKLHGSFAMLNVLKTTIENILMNEFRS